MTIQLTDEQIAAIRDGCEGVTPGPWYAEAQTGPVTDEEKKANTGVWAQSRFDTNAAKDDDQDPMDDAWLLGIWGVLTAEDYDNAVHIASCDPDTIRALATEVLESREALAAKDSEIERLRDALTNLVRLNDDHGPFGGEIYQDRIDRTWDRARAALEAQP
jgi:hypothetical protein